MSTYFHLSVLDRARFQILSRDFALKSVQNDPLKIDLALGRDPTDASLNATPRA